MPHQLHSKHSRRRRSYEVVQNVTEMGERFFVLINAATGEPPVLALRYALDRRWKNGSGELKRRLQAIAWLYEWFDSGHVALSDEGNLEVRLRSPQFLSQWDLRGAMIYADRRGDIGPSDDHSGTTLAMIRIHRPVSHHQRMADWRDFVEWALAPLNWRTGRRSRPSGNELLVRNAIKDHLEDFWEGARRPTVRYAHRRGFRPFELAILEDLVTPDEDGEWLAIPVDDGPPAPLWSLRMRMRNYLIFALMRWLGLRRSEVLKLKVEDIPTPLHRDGEIVGWTNAGRIVVRRREDDPEDSRAWEPKVKRHDRQCETPHELLLDLHRYITMPPPIGRSGMRNGYLFLTPNGIPLSIAATNDIKREIRNAACRLVAERFAEQLDERVNGGGRAVSRTLERFTWHRLRHTRARELYKHYRATAKPDEDWQERFRKYFGWASLESARPYLDDEHHDSGSRALAEHQTHVSRHARPNR